MAAVGFAAVEHNFETRLAVDRHPFDLARTETQSRKGCSLQPRRNRPASCCRPLRRGRPYRRHRRTPATPPCRYAARQCPASPAAVSAARPAASVQPSVPNVGNTRDPATRRWRGGPPGKAEAAPPAAAGPTSRAVKSRRRIRPAPAAALAPTRQRASEGASADAAGDLIARRFDGRRWRRAGRAAQRCEHGRPAQTRPHRPRTRPQNRPHAPMEQ
jgi:hypothetical protein